MWRGRFALKFFAQNIWKENITKYLTVMSRTHFKVNPHSIVAWMSTIWPVWLNGWVFVYEQSGSGLESSCSHYKIFIWYFHKFSVQDHLYEHYCTFEQFVGKTLIEIESAILNKQKMCDFVSFKTFYKRQFFTTVKGTFKNTYSCCCCCCFFFEKKNKFHR